MRWYGQRTPTVDEERLYAIRSDGDLVCLRVKDGQELWRRNYLQDFGTTYPLFGVCDYPLVDGERLVCSPDGSDATVVALDRRTGESVWKTSIDHSGLPTKVTSMRRLATGYSATVVTEVGGVRQYVAFVLGGLIGVAADDGRLLWRYEGNSSFVRTSITPIVHGNAILLQVPRFGSVLALLTLVPNGDGVRVREEYFHKVGINPFQDSAVWIGDQVHSFTLQGILTRFNAGTGEHIESHRFSGYGPSMTCADGALIIRDSEGVVSLISPAADGYVEKSRFSLPEREPENGSTNPVVTGGRLWLRDDNRLFCYDLRQNAEETRTLPTVVQLQPEQRDGLEARPKRPPNSVFVPTPHDIVDKMLECVQLGKDDMLYDLGSGDGRIVIAAAKQYGCTAVGYEIDKELVAVSRQKAEEAKVQERARFEQRDIFTVDISKASVIAVYLVPKQLEALLPQFRKLKPGTRIVSHQFQIPGIDPDQTFEVESAEDGNRHVIHVWTAPLSAVGD